MGQFPHFNKAGSPHLATVQAARNSISSPRAALRLPWAKGCRPVGAEEDCRLVGVEGGCRLIGVDAIFTRIIRSPIPRVILSRGLPNERGILLLHRDLSAAAGFPGVLDAFVDGFEVGEAHDAVLDHAGVAGGGVVLLDHVFDIGAGLLADAVEKFGAFFKDPAGGAGGGVFRDGDDVIEAGEGTAVGVDDHFMDDQALVEQVLVHADRGDAIERDHVVAAGKAGLPEALVVVGLLGVGFSAVLAGRLAIRVGGVFLGAGERIGQQQAGEEVKEGGLFHRGEMLESGRAFGERGRYFG